jgi:hypothetical protein
LDIFLNIRVGSVFGGQVRRWIEGSGFKKQINGFSSAIMLSITATFGGFNGSKN